MTWLTHRVILQWIFSPICRCCFSSGFCFPVDTTVYWKKVLWNECHQILRLLSYIICFFSMMYFLSPCHKGNILHTFFISKLLHWRQVMVWFVLGHHCSLFIRHSAFTKINAAKKSIRIFRRSRPLWNMNQTLYAFKNMHWKRLQMVLLGHFHNNGQHNAG